MARDVKVNILGDARDFSRAVGQADSDARRLDGSLGRVGGSMGRFAAGAALGLGAVAVAGGAMALSFVRAAEESQQVSRQTAATLESMGASAWTSAEQVGDLATSISNLTGIDDEMIQTGQNTLLTYGNITENFDRATRAMVDMAAFRGDDMAATADTIGKALNDPIGGITRLTRVGVLFTEQQKDQIRAMAEAGDMAGAQGIMLQELERQFGGSAEAQATASERLSTMWGNLQEQLGEALLPLFEGFVEVMGRFLPKAAGWATAAIGKLVPIFTEIRDGLVAFVNAWIYNDGEITSSGFPGFMERAAYIARQAFDKIRDAIETVVEKIGDLIGWLRENEEVTIAIAGAIGGVLVAAFVAWAVSATAAAVATLAAIWPLLLIGAAVAALAGGFIYLYRNNDTFREKVQAVVAFLRDEAWPRIKEGAELVGTFLVEKIQAAIDMFNDIKPVLTDVAGWVIDKISGIVGAVGGIVSIVQTAINKFRELAGLNGNMEKSVSSAYGQNAGRYRPPVHHSGVARFVAPMGQSEGLAILQTGEEVRSRSGVASDGGGGGRVVNIYLGGELLKRVVIDGLDAAARDGVYAPQPA